MKLPRLMAFARPDSPFRVTVYYALFGTLWIVGSDSWVAWEMGESLEILKVDMLKGLFFILATSGLLYVLVKQLERRHVAVEAALQDSQRRWQFALEGGGRRSVGLERRDQPGVFLQAVEGHARLCRG